jgi:hypothetical protein
MLHAKLRAMILASTLGCLAAGCASFGTGSDVKTVRAYNSATGEYFDVKVPYETHYGMHGRVSRDEPSQASVDTAVDKATSEAESSSRMQQYLERSTPLAISGGAPSAPGSTSTSSGPSVFDRHTSMGSSWHDSNSPFSR